LADGVEYTFWTFGGSVPGSFIRVREGDEIEFHLNNHPDSKMPHNIDLHAVTGPGGGATASFTPPGHTSTFSFKALNPGLFVYHCATAPVGMHVANGMYGLILVEPKAGLPKVDKEFYVMQSEFYTKGNYGDEGLQSFDMAEALTEIPDYVVFNGSVGAMTGDNALKAKVGETIRLFVGNGGPNLVSSFHVIGEIFDNVHIEGGSLINHNVQTTMIPAGGSAIVDFKVQVPGTLMLVDHSIFRAFNKGALGMIEVTGDSDLVVYSGKQSESVSEPEGDAESDAESDTRQAIFQNSLAPVTATSLAERMSYGQRIYEQNCMACHQQNGEGIEGVFPPLAGSDYLLSNSRGAIDVLVNGLAGKLIVNGATYDGVMPSVRLTNEQVANVLTYILNSWNNNGGEIKTGDVIQARSAH
jgi:nitrite reductase (NO-forming)